MPGSIGGFPVHNYGSDPLGRMGIEMFKSSLDWDEKRKELERKALIEAASQGRSAVMETVKGGTAAEGIGSQLYGGDIGGGIDRLNTQNRVAKEIEKLTSIIKMNTDQQAYNEKEITSIEAAQEKLMKRKVALMDAGGQEDMVVYMNDQLKAMDAKVSKLRGFSVGDSVTASDIASWKTTRQEEATKQIAELGRELDTALSSKTPDPEAIGAASAKLRVAVTTAQEKWKLPKETFTLESKLLGDANDAIKQNVVNQLKPKEPKPTYETQILPDGSRIQVESGTGKESLVQGRTPREPVTDDIALQRKAKYISGLMKIPEADAAQMILQGKQQTKAQFVSKIVQGQMELATPGKADPRLKQTIIEAGKLYDFIQNPESSVVPGQPAPGAPGKKSYKYLWEK